MTTEQKANIIELESCLDDFFESDLSERVDNLYNWLYEGSVHRNTVSELLALISLQSELITALDEAYRQEPTPAPAPEFFPMSKPAPRKR